jgi:N6-L-threonylcarbamoyladenine synthase
MLAAREGSADPQRRADIARGVEEAIVDTLVGKTARALDETGLGALVVAGGVSANRRLRAALEAAAAVRNVEIFFPRLEFCTDNGAMIAYAGCQRLLAGQCEPSRIASYPRWPLDRLGSV